MLEPKRQGRFRAVLDAGSAATTREMKYRDSGSTASIEPCALLAQARGPARLRCLGATIHHSPIGIQACGASLPLAADPATNAKHST
jgi:hypothetical protein